MEGDKEDQVLPVPDSPISENTEQKEAPEIAEKPQKTEEIREKPLYTYVSHSEWFTKIGWKNNPFVFNIRPFLLVGYKNQINAVMAALSEKQKITLILGPTGSGKTSLLTWISGNLPENSDCIYVSKPPSSEQEIVDIFNEKFKPPWFLRPFIPNIKNIYELPRFLNRKLKGKNMVLMIDECHEADVDVLEWIRVLSDQVENMQIALSGLPIFEAKVSSTLETLRKRIMVRIEVLYLTKEEMTEMIKKRIESVGGTGTEPFAPETIAAIYNRTGGFPRETIRLCNELVNKAAIESKFIITPDMVEERKNEEKSEITLSSLENMTPMQKLVIDFIARTPSSPGSIANSSDLAKYKSRQHAVRSINNILKRMLSDGIVERTRKDKAFIYQISPKFRTLVVKS
jgi:type II secretory pathway predicted ATPase ExeA